MVAARWEILPPVQTAKGHAGGKIMTVLFLPEKEVYQLI
jgi:hypothetical protein